MPRPFALPDLGEGLTEAEIVKVLVEEGDVLAEDAPLLEVETDKATVEIPSPFAGRVTRIHVQPGQTVKVGDVLVTFEDSAGAASGRREPTEAGNVGRPSTASTVGSSGRGARPAPVNTTARAGLDQAPAPNSAGSGQAPAAARAGAGRRG